VTRSRIGLDDRTQTYQTGEENPMNRNDTIVGIGVALLMGVCCGGPLLVLAGAAIVSAIGVPALAVVIGGIAVTVGIVLWRRHACTDCTTSPITRERELWKTRSGR
jgi:hypothetical protein